MNLIHLVCVPFTGLGIIDYRGDEWFKYRIELFKNYTLRSLINQSDKDFLLWLCFRSQEKENPLMAELKRAVKESGIKYIFTFDGIMMHDDRGLSHNKNLKERMEKSLAELKEIVGKAEWVYKTDLGSDDMFEGDAFKEIKTISPKEKGAMYYINGYVMDIENERIAEWNRGSSAPQFTISFPYETFFNAEKHFEYIKGFESHEFVPKVFDAVRLSDKKYMCGVHRGNISTAWNNPLRGRQFNDIEKKEIMEKFGLT